MNKEDVLAAEKEEIRQKEPRLLMKFVAESYERYTASCLRWTPGDPVARGITEITGLYAKAIKKAYGGWTCGTYSSSLRRALSRLICEEYEEKVLLDFIDFCVRQKDDPDPLKNADKDIKDMVVYFLSLRREPLVHPPFFQL